MIKIRIKNIANTGFFQPAPNLLHRVQLWAVRRQEYQFEPVVVLFKERLQQFCVMYPRIIKHHRDFLARVLLDDFAEEIHKRNRIALLVFPDVNLAAGAINYAKQFRAFVPAVSRYDFLTALVIPRIVYCLIVPYR